MAGFYSAVDKQLDYALAVVAGETAEALSVRLVHASQLFDAGHIQQVEQLLRGLLNQMASGSAQRWADFELVSPKELSLAVEQLRSPQAPCSEAGVFTELFGRQATLTPERQAVSCGDRSLTYSELDQDSDRLASLLIAEGGVRVEDPVVICLDRSLDIVVAVLAVMKAGGAYVPVDPAYPRERLELILEDAGAKVVLTHGAHRSNFDPLSAGGAGPKVFGLDEATCKQALAMVSPLDPPTVRAANLAYVIYTSGSTGRPKGVMVEHGSFCLVAEAVKDRFFAARAHVSTYSLTNAVFDIFGLEYALSLLSGGQIEIGDGLPETLCCRGVDFLQVTPSLLEILLDRLTETEATLLLCGGEPLRPDLLDRVMKREMDLVNLYGPTETTIWSTARIYRHAAPSRQIWTDLGRPLAGERIYVLDANLRPTPPGAVGELCIAGGGLARGYLNRRDLTAERFIEAPFGPGSERIYRTGDLVRLHVGGGLEFLRRNDSQVKLRGRRIEPAEIELAMAACPGVAQSAVAVRDDALVGYYVAEAALDPGALADRLHRTLPEHMVPAALVRLEAMPLTPSGKLDRRSLPAPAAETRGPAPPRSSFEERVRSSWARCLGLAETDVGIDDDFFWLGGDSLRSIRLCAELRLSLGVDVSLSFLQDHRTIRLFVDRLARVEAAPGDAGMGVAAFAENQVVSFAQERLWFAEGLSRGSAAYNIPLAVC